MMTNRQLRQRVKELEAENAGLKKWYDAVDNECVIAWIPLYEDDPRKTLQGLISWHCLVALDPQVSSDAQALIDMGIRRGRKDD